MVTDDFCYSLRVPTAIRLDVSVSGLLTELVVTVVGMRGNVALVTHFDGIELAANFHAMTQRRSGKKWKKLPLRALRLLLRTPSGTKKVTYRVRPLHGTVSNNSFTYTLDDQADYFFQFSYAPASYFRIFKVFNSWNFRSQYYRCSPP